MDKGFNDDELEDIMNEIESLEQEFSQGEETLDGESPKEPSLMDEIAESVASIVEEEVQEAPKEESVLKEVVSMPVEAAVPQQTVEKFEDDSHTNVVSLEKETHVPVSEVSSPKAPSPKTPASNTALKFNVEGDMQMELSFTINGTEVNLHISDNGFEIELEGGAKFTLPVGHVSADKKVA